MSDKRIIYLKKTVKWSYYFSKFSPKLCYINRFIYLKDLSSFLRDDEALKTMNLVEGSPEREKISKASLKNWVVRNDHRSNGFNI